MKSLTRKWLFLVITMVAVNLVSSLTVQQQANAGVWGCVGAQSSCLIYWYICKNGDCEIGVDEVPGYKTYKFE